jgi:hypothetical protein
VTSGFGEFSKTTLDVVRLDRLVWEQTFLSDVGRAKSNVPPASLLGSDKPNGC